MDSMITSKTLLTKLNIRDIFTMTLPEIEAMVERDQERRKVLQLKSRKKKGKKKQQDNETIEVQEM